MPSAAHTASSRRSGRGRSRAPYRTQRAAGGLRWDRIGRLALVGALVAILYLYISAGIRLRAALGEEQSSARAKAALAHEYQLLESRRAQLLSSSWIESQARRLGMAFPGEQQFELRGAPTG
jgi:cell division protein FtsL